MAWVVGSRVLSRNPGSFSSCGRCVNKGRFVFPQKWIDGGFTDSLPILPGGRTVTISPFSGRLDISPQDKGQLGLYVGIANQHILVSDDIHWHSKAPPRPEHSTCFQNGQLIDSGMCKWHKTFLVLVSMSRADSPWDLGAVIVPSFDYLLTVCLWNSLHSFTDFSGQ